MSPLAAFLTGLLIGVGATLGAVWIVLAADDDDF